MKNNNPYLSVRAMAILILAMGAAAFVGFRGAETAGWDTLRILFAFLLMVSLTRAGWKIGYVLVLAAFYLLLLFNSEFIVYGKVAIFGMLWPEEHKLHWIGYRGIMLAVTILFINQLGQLLSDGGAFRALIEALERLIRDLRAIVPIVPAFGGLLPMPGGAMLSAPVVNEIGDRIKMSAEDRAAINYWFRHVWEYWFPLYPAVIFAKGYFPLPNFILLQFPLTIVALAAGWFFMLRPLQRAKAAETMQGSRNPAKEIRTILVVLSPVIFVVAVSIIGAKLFDKWQVNKWLVEAVLPGVLLLTLLGVAQAISTCNRQRGLFVSSLRKAATFEIAILVLGVFLLQSAFDMTQAAQRLPDALRQASVPVSVVCFFVPVLVGLVTGYTIGPVATTFPMLNTFFIGSSALVPLAFTGGFLGVMISPVHLCLVLSTQYFHAELTRVYARFVSIVILVGLIAWGIWWFASHYLTLPAVVQQ